MSVQSMSFIFGALLLAVAILGGGFEVKEIKVSNVSIGVRFIAGIVGLCFIALGLQQSGALGFWPQLGAPTEPQSGSSVNSGTEPPRTAPRPQPKAPEALVAEEIPFISEHDRSDVRALYLLAPDHKALAISRNRMGMITGQADVETAKNGALANCRGALEAAQIGVTCDLYAVGNMVVYQRGHPPMPTPPWFRTDQSIARPFNSKDVPLVSDEVRLLMNYLGRPKPKALALSPRSYYWQYFGQSSQDDAARRALEVCGDVSGFPCMIIAVDDEFVIPIPTMMKPVGFFQPAGNGLIAPGSRDEVARRLATGTSGWSAVATGGDGLVGMVLNASNEQKAIEGALSDCSSHDRGCRVIAIGPFSVVAADVGKSP